jgi:hypothetical protein
MEVHVRVSSLLILVSLLLNACATGEPGTTVPPAEPTGTSAPVPTDEPARIPTSEPTASPAETAAPTASPESTAEPRAESTAKPKADPTRAPSCLAGTWTAANLIELARGIFTGQGQPVPTDLAVGGGDLTITFDLDGLVSYAYDDVTVQGTMDAGGAPLPMAIAVNGPGSAAYEIIDDRSITFSDAKVNDLEVAMTVAGQPAPAGAMARVFAIVSAAEETIEYTCEGDAAQLSFPEKADAPLMLERMP